MNLLIVIIYVSAALEIMLGGLVLFSNIKNKVHQLFAIVSIVTAYWIVTNSLITLEPNEFWVKNTYATGILLSPVILLWFIHFINKTKTNLPIIISVLFTTIVLYVVTLFSDLIIKEVTVSFTGGFNGTFGPIFPLFALHFIAVSVYILYLVTKAFHHSRGIEKIQYKYIALGLYGFGLIVGIVNFILPLFGITFLIPFDSTSSLIFITYMSIAITRHHLFNIKVIAVELATFSLWIFLLIRTILAHTSQDMILDGTLFGISVILGVILIRSVLSELKQREQIERLMRDVEIAYKKVKETNDHLADQIAAQTKDVRRAYEVEKEAVEHHP